MRSLRFRDEKQLVQSLCFHVTACTPARAIEWILEPPTASHIPERAKPQQTHTSHGGQDLDQRMTAASKNPSELLQDPGGGRRWDSMKARREQGLGKQGDPLETQKSHWSGGRDGSR